MLNILEVQNLHKKIGKKEIIKGISFTVKDGEIFGFLGPNGAGKTTTIKMLLGLVVPTKGHINISGYDIRKNYEKALCNVGSIVEYPDTYTYMTGMQNLMQLYRMQDNIKLEEIDEIVELVGLQDKINEKVKKYSLGMKQRLGLAEALMCKPKLLILDEPTNGLDPSGMLEFRNIIKKVASENHTAVFISSHMLSEMQELCNTVAFIDDGLIKTIETINGDAIVSSEPTKKPYNSFLEHVVLKTSKQAEALKIIRSLSYIRDVSIEEETLNLNIDKNNTSKLVIKLVENNIPVEEIYKKHTYLEERYIEVVKGCDDYDRSNKK